MGVSTIDLTLCVAQTDIQRPRSPRIREILPARRHPRL